MNKPRVRFAPSPTGYLHIGGARTALFNWLWARKTGGTFVLRIEDTDQERSTEASTKVIIDSMRWLGLDWQEPMVTQSGRIPLYRAALARLHAAGLIFSCSRSRRDVLAAASAPHDGEENDEPLYPPEFRPAAGAPLPPLTDPIAVNWRFRVPDGETLVFRDGQCGEQRATAGRDYGDFLVWRKDDAPSYQLACVVDDAAMGITEVVRGADLIKSTFRQLLLFRALGFTPPAFYHCPLVTDEAGVRLAKRHDALSLRTLREQNRTPDQLRTTWASE